MDNTDSKKQEVIAELKEWFGRPNCKEFYYDEPIATIEGNLSELRIKKSVWLSFDQLENWHKNRFVLKSLTENDLSDRTPMAGYGYFVAELTDTFAKHFPNNPPSLDLHKIAGFLANTIIQKWYDQAEKVLGSILEGLDTKYLKGGQDYKNAAWFIVTVACKAFQKDLPAAKYNYPKEMGVYRQIIDEWDTENPEEVNKFVSELCNYHLSQASYGDGKNVMGIQFSFTNEFVYAFEVLSWLALREMKGLPNPKTYSHRLMSLPINQLPDQPAPYQPTDLMQKVSAKVKKDFQA